MAYFEKYSDEEYRYSYDGVNGSILAGYVTPELIDAYLDDEVFLDAIKERYVHIDLDNPKDMARFETRIEKTAAWLRKQVERESSTFE